MQYILTQEEYDELKDAKKKVIEDVSEAARRLIVHLGKGHQPDNAFWKDTDFTFIRCIHDKVPKGEHKEEYCNLCPLIDIRLLRKLGISSTAYDICKKEKNCSK